MGSGALCTELGSVDRQRDSLAEVLISKYGLVLAGSLASLKGVDVAVEGKLGGVGLRSVEYKVGASVGCHIGGIQRYVVKLALEEGLKGGSLLLDYNAVDSGGLELALVLAVGPAVPLVVLLDSDLLVCLVSGELVGTVGSISLGGSAVLGLGKVALGELVGLVEVFLDYPVAGEVVLKIEIAYSLAEVDSYLVIAGLDKSDVLPGSLGVGAGLKSDIVRSNALISLAGGKIVVIEIL